MNKETYFFFKRHLTFVFIALFLLIIISVQEKNKIIKFILPIFAISILFLFLVSLIGVEIKGSKSSHIRDGVSICKFLFWLDKNIEKNKYVSEKSASTKLYKLREKNKLFQGLSFETIPGYGSNGSIIHYRVTKKSNN